MDNPTVRQASSFAKVYLPKLQCRQATADKFRLSKPLPFYLIAFQDIKAADHKIAELKAAAFPDGVSPFNEAVFYGDEASAERIISSCQTPPFSGGRHCILVRRAEKLKKEDKEILFAYLKKPSPFAFLIFLFQVDRNGWKSYAGKFSKHQIQLFFVGEELEFADHFGITNALRRRNPAKALKILDHQYGDQRDFYRFFGIFAWYLRNRVERTQGRMTRKDAALFERLYEIDNNFRRGSMDGRIGLELIIFALNE